MVRKIDDQTFEAYSYKNPDINKIVLESEAAGFKFFTQEISSEMLGINQKIKEYILKELADTENAFCEQMNKVQEILANNSEVEEEEKANQKSEAKEKGRETQKNSDNEEEKFQIVQDANEKAIAPVQKTKEPNDLANTSNTDVNASKVKDKEKEKEKLTPPSQPIQQCESHYRRE